MYTKLKKQQESQKGNKKLISSNKISCETMRIEIDNLKRKKTGSPKKNKPDKSKSDTFVIVRYN